MGVKEPRIIDEITGKYDGRKLKKIPRDNGKIDFKVRKRAEKRRQVLKPPVVKTDYKLDPEKDVKRVETRSGEQRIYLLPISGDLQVHRENTVHQRKMNQIEESFDRDEQKIKKLERENRQLKRDLDRLTEEDDNGQSTSVDVQQRYECQSCGENVTENQADRNHHRCPECGSEELELM
ncbi:hypothetical protein HT576_08665 [Haloterrigena sp. SYSU A121-1]|uniref:Uncharacterized protein n=1 Tax=Haloterrigena gelatinilytica TaxID=2741724 RepID=A0A8J8KF02_9EURY|nr:hypothetical protein [Haloterrigena gelatinilytica]NUB91091.1 hypothetical protein [Haloterrigena gelatinilytica]